MTMHTPTIERAGTRIGGRFRGELPADVIAAFTADQSALDARGVPPTVVAPGSVMPDGDLLDVHGAPTSLARLRGGRPAVVVFYRGAWCPYCNIALRTYQAELVPALGARGVELIAVSPQKPDGSLTSAESNELTYSVASDPGNQIATALGILTEPSSESLAAQAQVGAGPHRRECRRWHSAADAHDRRRRRSGHHPVDRRAPQLHHPQRGARHPGRGRRGELKGHDVPSD